MTVIVIAGSGFLKPIGLVEGFRGSVDVSEAHFHRGCPIPHGKEHGLEDTNCFYCAPDMRRLHVS